MSAYPAPLERLIARLASLPGLGRKSAARVAMYLLRAPDEVGRDLARAMVEVKEKIRFCSVCHNFADQEPCRLCSDPDRRDDVLCVVETPGDVLALESAGVFDGRYHVLQGVLSPLDGIGPEDLQIAGLMRRLDSVREVILATSPTAEGRATAGYLADLLAGKDVAVTRLAIGLPLGSDLKFADAGTLGAALTDRRRV
ncbi:MAG: recombination mediator RecR [Proteobacteria bacterium]|nr:recombination mediator RecR [Pseudomonadota bacterium]